MQTPLLPPLKNYNLATSQRKRFQLIIDGQDKDDNELFFLKPYEKETLKSIIADYLQALDTKQSLLLDKLAQLNGVSGNDQKYEHSRRKIATAVQQHILRHNAMPTNQQIAQLTGINRNTVTKHLTDHLNNARETIARYSYAANGLLDMILHDAHKHRNILAARIYLDAFYKMARHHSPPAQLTIADTTITQQTIDNLTPLQQQAILNILQPQPTLQLPEE